MSTSPPPALTALAATIDAALDDYLERALPRLVGLHPSLGPLADELRAFVTGGGKRIRPALLLLGYRAAGRTDLDAVTGPALSLELLHTCALLHDDIIDAAPTRRGRETAHRRFAREHRDAGWSGPSDAFGEAVAILLGDLAFVQADELFLEGRVPADRILAGLRRFTVLREEVMAGQYVDLYAARAGVTSRELALAVATYKSGRYSVARPLEIGAVLGGAPEELVAGLARVGGPLGRAFQVRDDVLGVFGDEAETGKSVAGDLVEGKRTLLVAETAARLAADDLATFERLLGDPDLTPEDAAVLRGLMRDSGGLAAAARYVEEAVEEARAALAALDVPADVAEALAGMAAFIRDRQR
ncbi:MAG: polyprenyl synthetase family protein [Actinobacteria bacterium]|nr:polyprenyl synthetase family protein [Actinomycetota bacterium]